MRHLLIMVVCCCAPALAGGRLVAPGHYLLRIEIDADRADVWTGLVGVVY